MNKKLIGAGAICLAAILWGIDGVILTPRLFNLDVSFVVLMIHLIPFVFMAIFLHKEFRHLKKFDSADYSTMLLIALFGGAIGTLSIVKALFLVNFTQLSVVVLIQKLQPVFAIALAAVLLKERIKERFIIWASIAVIATYFLAFGFALPNFGTGTDTARAAFFALLAAFSFGAATVFGRKFMLKHSFTTATFYRFFFTTSMMLIYTLLMGTLLSFESITRTNWIVFIIIAVTSGSGAIFLYYFGLKRIKASIATIAELCFPATAIILDYFVNDSILSPIQWMAAIVLIFAITRVSLEKSKR